MELWDHTANRGRGEWQTVQEHPKGWAVRYLGVMISANRHSKAQSEKVDREVRKVLVIAKIGAGQCSAEMATYLMQACVGGFLNYHAPFTNITDGNVELWDRSGQCCGTRGGPPFFLGSPRVSSSPVVLFGFLTSVENKASD